MANTVKEVGPEIYPLKQRPTKKEEGGEGWSVDIFLISGEKKLRGYYDPRGSIAGGKYFYYTSDKNNPIVDCALLEEFPTGWYYAEEGI